MKKTTSIFVAACIASLLTTRAAAVEVAHYSFEGDFTDSATADGAQDLTGAGGVGTTSPGFVGSSLLLLDGFDDRVTSTANLLGGAAGVTLTTWFSPGSPITGAQSEDYTIIQLPIIGGTGLNQSAIGLEIQDGKLQVGGRSSSADTYQLYLSPTLLQMGKTYFAAVTLDFAAKRVDGFLYNLSDDLWEAGANAAPVWAQGTSAGNNGISIGRRADNLRYFKGSVDDVHIFTNVLTEAQLQAMAGYEPPAVDGDYDDDGDVDGNDLLAWQRGESPNGMMPGDLDAWRMNFGSPGITPVASTVPEPASAVLLGGLIATLGFRRKRN
jgi:hypothetical protein